MNNIPYLVAKDENTIQIHIDDEIGFWGVTAQSVIQNIKDSGAKNIELRINSVGGSVTDALSIYNYLKDHKGIITVKVDGLAASAATVIAQAANKNRRYTAESAMWMVHEASMGAWGKKAEIEEQIKALDVANESIKSIYRANGVSEETITSMFDGGDHWFTGAESINLGFADKAYNAGSKASAKAYAIAAKAQEVPEEIKIKLQSNIMAEEKNFLVKLGASLVKMGGGELSPEDTAKELDTIKNEYEQEIKAHNEKVTSLEAKVSALEAEKQTEIDNAVKPINEEKEALTAQVQKLESDLAEALSKIETPKGHEDKGPENKTPEMSEREKALEENAKAIRDELKNRI